VTIRGDLTPSRAARRAEFPHLRLGRKELFTMALFAAITLGALYYVLPRLAGLGTTWDMLRTRRAAPSPVRAPPA
jgi:hypothetical protein